MRARECIVAVFVILNFCVVWVASSSKKTNAAVSSRDQDLKSAAAGSVVPHTLSPGAQDSRRGRLSHESQLNP